MKSLLIVALRIGGIFLIIQFMNRMAIVIPNYYESFKHADDYLMLALWYFGPPIIELSLGLLLWFIPDKFVSQFSKNIENSDNKNIDVIEIQTVLISVIAIFLIFNSLSDIIYYISLHLSLKESLGFAYNMDAKTQAGLISSISKGLLSAFLLAKSSSISTSLYKNDKIYG